LVHDQKYPKCNVWVLEKQRKFDIMRQLLFLNGKNDSRKLISTSDLLHMNSGLQWIEDYASICDATKCFQTETWLEQLEKPQNINPIWNGIILLELQICFPYFAKQFKTHQEYLDFWYTDLIEIGMNSMVVETDMKLCGLILRLGNYSGLG
jgi:hypothetical protein